MRNHTPGPWIVEHGGNVIWGAGDRDGEYMGYPVAYLTTLFGHIPQYREKNQPMMDANARLVSAAPDLLEAAIDVLDEWDTPNWKLKDSTGSRIAKLRAAVSKARGSAA